MPSEDGNLQKTKDIAMSMYGEGRLSEAKSHFADLCRANANDAGAQFMLAATNLRLGDFAATEAGMRLVISMLPQMVDAHFMLGQALLGQNRLDEAADSFRNALRINPDMIDALNAMGWVHHLKGMYEQALVYYRRVLAIRADNLDAWVNQATALEKLDRHIESADSYRQALALQPDSVPLRCALGTALVLSDDVDNGLEMLHAGLSIRSDRVDALANAPAVDIVYNDTHVEKSANDVKDITIATTIAPKNTANQRAAIESWKSLGFSVVSINSAEEIARLRPAFPDIDFVTAKRDARRTFGKPYIYFDDMLSFFRERDDIICGIINSDIHLEGNSLKSIIGKEARDSFLFGCRLDVASLSSEQGRFYRDGFDYFFLDRKHLDVYPESDFCLGLPWWDYWAVIVPLLDGVPVKKITAPVARHISHAVNWDEISWKRLGCRVTDYVGMTTQPTTHMMSLCARYIVFLVEKHSRKLRITGEKST